MSAVRPVYGIVDVAVVNERSRVASTVPLLILVIALAIATVWFVALPAVGKPPRATPSCEVIVLKSGSTKCIPEADVRSGAALQPLKPSVRSTQPTRRITSDERMRRGRN